MITFLGDSHFSRMRGLSVWDDATNLAVGGVTVTQLAPQLAHIPATSTVVFVSIGTNDSAPHNGVSVEEFTTHLTSVFRALRNYRVVYVASPGVVEHRPAGKLWTADLISAYRDQAQQICTNSGVGYINFNEKLAHLGDRAFAEDGLHLSPAGYHVLVEALHNEM